MMWLWSSEELVQEICVLNHILEYALALLERILPQGVSRVEELMRGAHMREAQLLVVWLAIKSAKRLSRVVTRALLSPLVLAIRSLVPPSGRL